MWELLPHVAGDRAQVEVGARVTGLHHLAHDRARHDVARGELAVGVVVGHEPVAASIHENPTFPRTISDTNNRLAPAT